MEENKTETQKAYIKPIGEEMVNLIEEIQKKFRQKYDFCPSITDITNMIAKAVKEKGGIRIT